MISVRLRNLDTCGLYSEVHFQTGPRPSFFRRSGGRAGRLGGSPDRNRAAHLISERLGPASPKPAPTGMPMAAPESVAGGPTRGRGLRASCSGCYESKKQCDTPGPPEKCRRCVRLNLDCVFLERLKPGPKGGRRDGRGRRRRKGRHSSSGSASDDIDDDDVSTPIDDRPPVLPIAGPGRRARMASDVGGARPELPLLSRAVSLPFAAPEPPPHAFSMSLPPVRLSHSMQLPPAPYPHYFAHDPAAGTMPPAALMSPGYSGAMYAPPMDGQVYMPVADPALGWAGGFHPAAAYGDPNLGSPFTPPYPHSPAPIPRPIAAGPPLPDSDTLNLIMSSYLGPLYYTFPLPIRSELVSGLSDGTVPEYLACSVMFWALWYGRDLPDVLGESGRRTACSQLFARATVGIGPDLDRTLTGYDALFPPGSAQDGYRAAALQEYRRTAVSVCMALNFLVSVAAGFGTPNGEPHTDLHALLSLAFRAARAAKLNSESAYAEQHPSAASPFSAADPLIEHGRRTWWFLACASWTASAMHGTSPDGGPAGIGECGGVGMYLTPGEYETVRSGRNGDSPPGPRAPELPAAVPSPSIEPGSLYALSPQSEGMIQELVRKRGSVPRAGSSGTIGGLAPRAEAGGHHEVRPSSEPFAPAASWTKLVMLIGRIAAFRAGRQRPYETEDGQRDALLAELGGWYADLPDGVKELDVAFLRRPKCGLEKEGSEADAWRTVLGYVWDVAHYLPYRARAPFEPRRQRRRGCGARLRLARQPGLPRGAGARYPRVGAAQAAPRHEAQDGAHVAPVLPVLRRPHRARPPGLPPLRLGGLGAAPRRGGPAAGGLRHARRRGGEAARPAHRGAGGGAWRRRRMVVRDLDRGLGLMLMGWRRLPADAASDVVDCSLTDMARPCMLLAFQPLYLISDSVATDFLTEK
ncbi:hypothetical protein DFJ74DRAFT_358162 [Hyaloraphidium curvatum]|nr:hypothetical protein DFJ74DRAFT_358162 [Hyaloraphidium curvatum]